MSQHSRSRWDVVGVGGNSVDDVYVLPAYPQPHGPNAKMRISSRSLLFGGQVTTALATCAAMGLRTRYCGATGADDNGRKMREELARRGIDVTDVVVRDAPNGFAVILVDDAVGERIVLWDRDERLALQDAEVPSAAIASARAVHVDDVDQPAAIGAAQIGRDAGAIVTSDIEHVTAGTERLIRAVTHPVFAEHTPAALTGEDDLERALRKLRPLNAGPLIVTQGALGAIVLDGDRLVQVPGFVVDVVDTTGAGDVFRGGLIHALLAGSPVVDAVRFANAAAALSCTRLGAMAGAPTLAETRALLDAS